MKRSQHQNSANLINRLSGLCCCVSRKYKIKSYTFFYCRQKSRIFFPCRPARDGENQGDRPRFREFREDAMTLSGWPIFALEGSQRWLSRWIFRLFGVRSRRFFSGFSGCFLLLAGCCGDVVFPAGFRLAWRKNG